MEKEKKFEIEISRKVKELKEKIEQQKKILLELLEKWYYYKYEVEPRIMFEYEKIFGDLVEELETKTDLFNNLERKLSLLFVKLNRGAKIDRRTFEVIEKNSQIDNRKHKITLNTHSANFPVFTVDTSASESEKNKELNRMYKILVKKLHPDVAGETEFFKKFWVAIQDSYKEKNYQRLRLFYKTIAEENHYEDFEPTDLVEKLEQDFRDLQLLIGIEKRILERMLKSEPFIFEAELKNPEWVKQHRKKLKDKIDLIERQIDFNKRLLKKFEEIIEE